MIYQVYNQYHHDFIRYAKSLVTRKEDAYDLVQETYVKAIEREEIFEQMNEYEIKGWFFRVIKNKFIDQVRKNKRIIFSEEEHMLTTSVFLETDIFFQEMVDILPDHLRTPIILKYRERLNSKEIGELQGISPSTVRNRLSQGLKKLKNGGVKYGDY